MTTYQLQNYGVGLNLVAWQRDNHVFEAYRPGPHLCIDLALFMPELACTAV